MFARPRKTTIRIDATRAAIGVNKELAHLGQVLDPAHVPLTCILLQDRGETCLKTLVDTTRFSAHLPATEADHEGPQWPSGSMHINGVPRALGKAEASEVDAIGAETMFGIASLAKPLLAITYCFIIEEKIFPSLTWDKSVLTWMKELYGRSIPTAIIEDAGIDADLSVKDILLHRRALPGLNQFLFLADGTFQMTDEDFLKYFARLSCTSNKDKQIKASYEYSNANYILMALLLEKQAGCSIDEIMQKHLFDPLEMTRTTLDSNKVTDKAYYPTENYALGQRISGDLIPATATPEQHYKDSTAYKISIGMWSCTKDIAKLYTAILGPFQGRNGHFTSNMVQTFLEYYLFQQEGVSQRNGISLAGRVLTLSAQDHGNESLNYAVRKSTEPSDEPASASGKSVPDLFYKGGTSDGFTSTVYFHPSTQMFAVVLSNTSGPLDVTEPVARHALRIAMRLQYNLDIDSAKLNFQTKLNKQLARGVSLWLELEAENTNLADWSGNMENLNGVYQHDDHRLQMEIQSNQAIFSRVRQDRREVLTMMDIRASRTDSDRLRLFPKHHGIFVDRLTSFRNLELVVTNSSTGRVILLTNKRATASGVAVSESYVKQ